MSSGSASSRRGSAWSRARPDLTPLDSVLPSPSAPLRCSRRTATTRVSPRLPMPRGSSISTGVTRAPWQRSPNTASAAAVAVATPQKNWPCGGEPPRRDDAPAGGQRGWVALTACRDVAVELIPGERVGSVVFLDDFGREAAHLDDVPVSSSTTCIALTCLGTASLAGCNAVGALVHRSRVWFIKSLPVTRTVVRTQSSKDEYAAVRESHVVTAIGTVVPDLGISSIAALRAGADVVDAVLLSVINQLTDTVAGRLAANRGTFVSELVASQIEELTAADLRYGEAKRRAEHSSAARVLRRRHTQVRSTDVRAEGLRVIRHSAERRSPAAHPAAALPAIRALLSRVTQRVLSS